MTKTTKKPKCRYCEYKRDYEYLVKTTRSHTSDGLRVHIDGDQLVVSGWYDSMVGIEPVEAKINFCPMCGRKLGETA